MKYISIGGWCGTTMSLRQHKLYKDAYPFDHIRSTFNGIINCIETDFANFFPKKIEVDKIPNYPAKSYRGKYFGFYHHDLTSSTIIDDFTRRIERFSSLLESYSTKIIFVRTITTHDYNDEVQLTDFFINSLEIKYPSLEFLLILIIPGQDKSMFYKKLNKKTFIFTLNDTSENLKHLGIEYKPIYDYLKQNDLFQVIPKDNTINIKNGYNRFVEFAGIPTVRDDN